VRFGEQESHVDTNVDAARLEARATKAKRLSAELHNY